MTGSPARRRLARVHFEPSASLFREVLVQHRQRDVGQQRRQNPPRGVPVIVSRLAPSWARTPARRNAFINPSTRSSPTRSRTRSVRAVWSIWSKHAPMSASNTLVSTNGPIRASRSTPTVTFGFTPRPLDTTRWKSSAPICARPRLSHQFGAPPTATRQVGRSQPAPGSSSSWSSKDSHAPRRATVQVAPGSAADRDRREAPAETVTSEDLMDANVIAARVASAVDPTQRDEGHVPPGPA
jgi:hypothetical protein